MTQEWYRPDQLPPPEGVVVLAMDSSGHVQELKKRKGLWWFKYDSMYVYFTPTFWTPKQNVSPAARNDVQTKETK